MALARNSVGHYPKALFNPQKNLQQKMPPPPRAQGSDPSSFRRDILILEKGSLSACGENFNRKAPVDRSSSRARGTLPSPAAAAATELMLLRRSWCCCDRAGAIATELVLRAARVPSRGVAASLLEVLPGAPRGGTRR